MTMKKILPFTLLLPIVLGGCATKQKPQIEEKELFATNIKADDSKLFSFSITAASSKNSGKRGEGKPGGRPEGKSKNKPDSAEVYQKNLYELYTKLEYKLAESRYCREGYIEIDTYQADGRMHILGECNDSATPEDRERFANNYGY
jgi:hypothetical protein